MHPWILGQVRINLSQETKHSKQGRNERGKEQLEEEFWSAKEMMPDGSEEISVEWKDIFAESEKLARISHRRRDGPLLFVLVL